MFPAGATTTAERPMRLAPQSHSMADTIRSPQGLSARSNMQAQQAAK
jgi:hypothetical protein